MDVKMNDAKLIELLLDTVKQDDKRNYFGFVKVRSNSRMSSENITVTSDSFDENYEGVKGILDGLDVDKQRLRYLRGKLMEGGFFTELSTSFDLYNGPFVAFLASILAISIYLPEGKVVWWVQTVLSIMVIGAASFSLFRRSQTNTQKVRLHRLKNYLDVYLDNYDFYQEEAVNKVLLGDKEGAHAACHN